MKAVLQVLLAACVATLLTACALLQPLDDDARRSAKLALTAYEATQQAILIYGRLPDCEPNLPPLCKDPALWRKLKAADATATSAIATGADVVTAITAVNTLLKHALTNMGTPKT